MTTCSAPVRTAASSSAASCAGTFGPGDRRNSFFAPRRAGSRVSGRSRSAFTTSMRPPRSSTRDGFRARARVATPASASSAYEVPPDRARGPGDHDHRAPASAPAGAAARTPPTIARQWCSRSAMAAWSWNFPSFSLRASKYLAGRSFELRRGRDPKRRIGSFLRRHREQAGRKADHRGGEAVGVLVEGGPHEAGRRRVDGDARAREAFGEPPRQHPEGLFRLGVDLEAVVLAFLEVEVARVVAPRHRRDDVDDAGPTRGAQRIEQELGQQEWTEHVGGEGQLVSARAHPPVAEPGSGVVDQ